MNLNKNQQQAVEYLEGPLLVLAGPGTGKTQLLSSKVAHILEHTDTNPENILCITFTDNATTNMRTRLTSLIGPAATKVKISTYHAFGHEILSEYQNYTPDFDRELLSPISEVAQYKILKEIQENLPARDILQTTNPKNNLSDIRQTISEAKSARLTPSDLQKIAEENQKTTALLNPKIAEIFAEKPSQKWQIAIENTYRPLLAVLTNFTSPTPITKNIEPEPNYLARTLLETIEKIESAEKPSVSPLTKWKNDHLEIDQEGNYRLKNLVANLKLKSLAEIYRAYEQKLREEGLFDFNDMIEEAAHFLKTDRGFRLTLSEKCQYILLDEFQDTNPAQFEIIKLLTDYEKPNVMAVGDDDQAIFEFQGANASNLLDFQEHYDAKIITLTENYRSTPEILALSRKIADQLDESFAKQHQVDKTLTAKAHAENEGLITRENFPSADAEAFWLAQKISDLIDAGENQNEIAIIARKHKNLLPLLPYLKQHENINISYEKRDNIFDHPAISQLLKTARFVYELADEKLPAHSLLEILSFPFWGIPPIEAIKIAQKAKTEKRNALEVLASSDNPKIQQTTNLLASLVQLSHDTPLELFLDYLLGTTPIPTPEAPETQQTLKSPFLDFFTTFQSADKISALTDINYQTFELYECLAVLRENLHDYLKSENLRLKDLVTFLDDYELAGATLLNKSPYRSATNAISLLSVHSAKGLEFKHVFLVSVDSLNWGSAKGNNNLLVLPKNLTEIRHTGTTNDERLRLFFVALTRAKTHLYLTNANQSFDGKSLKPLEYLAETEEISPYLPETTQKINHHKIDLNVSEKQTDLHAHWLDRYAELTPDLRPILLNRLETYRLTATDLTTFLDLRYAGPKIFYRRKILNEPQEPTTENLCLGNLLHNTLDQVAKKHLDLPAALDHLHQQIAKEDLSEKERNDLTIRADHALKITLETFGDLIRAKTTKTEVDFFHDHLEFDKIRLTGKIDLISLDPETKTLEIYDYKTGDHHVPGPRAGWGSDLSLLKYSLQLEFYRLLLKSSPAYKNYDIPRAHILFINPDHENQIYQETYEFIEKSTEEFKKLLKSVFTHITTLDFIEDPNLFLDPDKSASASDVKNFINLLTNDQT